MVSVVVPVYNNEKYVRECVHSILGQSFTDLEIILVDDGSTDASGRICDEMARADSRVIVEHTSNRGVSAARNLGIDMATGTHIMFVDSDDALHPEMVQTLVDLKDSHHAVCAVCAFTDRQSNLSTEGYINVYSSRQAIEMTLYQCGMDSSLCCKLFPAEAIKNIRLREGLRYEDLDSIYRIYEHISGPILSTTAPMYLYRHNPDSFINNFSPDRLDVLEVTDRIVDHYHDDPEMLPAACDRRFAAHFNMFILATRAGLTAEADRCWQVISAGRGEEFRNPKVRRKNKAGALVSCLGRPFTVFLIKLFS